MMNKSMDQSSSLLRSRASLETDPTKSKAEINLKEREKIYMNPFGFRHQKAYSLIIKSLKYKKPQRTKTVEKRPQKLKIPNSSRIAELATPRSLNNSLSSKRKLRLLKGRIPVLPRPRNFAGPEKRDSLVDKSNEHKKSNSLIKTRDNIMQGRKKLVNAINNTECCHISHKNSKNSETISTILANLSKSSSTFDGTETFNEIVSDSIFIHTPHKTTKLQSINYFPEIPTPKRISEKYSPQYSPNISMSMSPESRNRCIYIYIYI